MESKKSTLELGIDDMPEAGPGRAAIDSPRPAIAVLGAVGAAVPLTLSLLGQAALPASLLGSGAVAALTALFWVRADRKPASPVETRSPEKEARPPPPFAAILENLVDPVLVIAGGRREDPASRRFLIANAAARELLRIQRSAGPLTTAVRAPEVLAAVDEALFERVIAHALYESGGVQERVWRVRAAPLEDLGQGPMALLSLSDETEFRRSERTRADFLANASHELRTPLASLSGFIETLRGHARDDPDARERFLSIMQDQAERMRRLIDDLMSLSRIELSEHIPPHDEVDLAAAATDVLDALAPLAADRGVVLGPLIQPADGVRVIGDRDQLLQVVQNLVENAIKYSPQGQSVAVEVEIGLSALAAARPRDLFAAHLSLLTPDHAPDRRYALLRVRDLGPGIARGYLPRLTERFYRVEGQKSSAFSGTGLGLAIVKHIVNRHRGGMTVESIEGRGAAFSVYIPMADRIPLTAATVEAIEAA
jgi:two-component system phosphate regulon sensor histidine kinase PhoR